MKLTGPLDFDLLEAQNILVEQFSALPSFDPSYEGRLIFVNAGLDYGFYVGLATGWDIIDTGGGGPSGGGTASVLKFMYFGPFVAGQTDVEIYDREGQFQRVLMPAPGSIVRTALQSTSPRTAGQLTAEPTINGAKVTNNALDLVLDNPTPNDDYAAVAIGQAGLTFAAGDKLGVRFTSDGTWANGGGTLEFNLWLAFNA